MSSRECAEVLLLKEIVPASWDGAYEGKYVRVTGYVEAVGYNINNGMFLGRYCTLTHKEATVIIQCDLVDVGKLRDGGLVQIFGTVTHTKAGVFIRAKIIRNVDGMNLELFEEVVLRRRSYLASS